MPQIGSYDEFTKKLQEAGFRTTKINENRNEAGFDDYGFALSDELQNRITSSFDNEQDYVLQAEIASIFKNSNTNYIHRSDFVKALRAMGYTVECSSEKSSYLPDHKAHNRMGKYDLETASIGIYTISDGKGGKIVIADANGNGALEIEEVFMNQILSDIALDVDQIRANFKEGGSVRGIGSSGDGSSDFDTKKKEAEKIAQEKYNSTVEKYLARGYSMSQAEAQAAIDLNATGFNYTGSKKARTKKEEEPEVSQNEFNKKVEKDINEEDEASKLDKSEDKANTELKTEDFTYTGTMKDRIKKKEEELDLLFA